MSKLVYESLDQLFESMNESKKHTVKDKQELTNFLIDLGVKAVHLQRYFLNDDKFLAMWHNGVPQTKIVNWIKTVIMPKHTVLNYLKDLNESKTANIKDTHCEIEQSKSKKKLDLSKKSKAEEAIKSLEEQIENAKKPGAFKSTIEKNAKIKELKEKILKWKTKMDESSDEDMMHMQAPMLRSKRKVSGFGSDKYAKNKPLFKHELDDFDIEDDEDVIDSHLHMRSPMIKRNSDVKGFGSNKYTKYNRMNRPRFSAN